MKKLFYGFLLAIVCFTVSYAEPINECKTDVYFGNGVRNDPDQAKKGQEELNKIIQREIIKNNPTLQAKYGEVKLSYNWGKGDLNDLLETFFQLKNAGQMSDLGFFLILSKLTYGGLDGLSAAATLALMAKMPAIAEVEQANVDEMLASYYLESFQWSHRVLLVSHSQGNMFANRIYDSLGTSDSYKGYEKYFTNVQVGSPASSVHAPDGKYITNRGDLVINPIPGSMIGNANPDPSNRVSSECLSALLSFESVGIYNNCLNEKDNHKFVPFYLGQKDPYSKIIPAIRYQLESLKQRKTQWNSAERGCICKDKHATVTHKFDDEANELMQGKKVKDFTSVSGGEGKIYPLTYQSEQQYVKASEGGVQIEEVEESETCYVLRDDVSVELGEIKGPKAQNITTQNGAIETTLSWTQECDINMDLSLYGNNVQQDVKDVENLGLEHAYVASESDIYPYTTYVASATGEKRPESNLEESYLEDNPINIYTIVKTPSKTKFKHYEVKTFEQLNLKEFAEIEVTINKEFLAKYNQPKEIVDPVNPPIGGGGFGSAGSGGGGDDEDDFPEEDEPRLYDECYTNNNGHNFRIVDAVNCGCVPCEYIIHGMENSVEYGPIGDAEVEIVRADTYGTNSPDVVYRGKSTNDNNLFKSGHIEFSQEDYAKFEDDFYYVVSAVGGEDLDRNDDMIKDDVPTKNKGTIHAIIKGSDLKTVAFRVNVLTEAIYHVSGELLGENYNAQLLDAKLKDAAQKLFREKTFVINGELGINYHDALLWAPAVDKKKLVKPYDTFVEPIVVKTYADEARVKESYRLIYEKLDTDAPQLSPLAVEIPHTIPNNSIIGKVNIESEGVRGIDYITLGGDANSTFSIDKEGLVKVVGASALILDAIYKLDMVAVGVDGKHSISMELVVKVVEGVPLADPNATVPTLESVELQDIIENSVGGTVVGQVNFVDSSLNIVSYILGGEYNSSFVIDSAGEITVADSADIDYEKSDIYSIKVSAINEAGNESFPVALSIKIINEIDTPLHDLVYLTHLWENVPIGTVVGKIVQLREGRSPITSFDILNPNVPFALDVNGTIRTTGYINYEDVDEYDLLAIAKTDSGNGNKVEIQILIDDVYPETGKPTIQPFTANIDENTNSGVEVGQLRISQGENVVERIELRGTGHSNFTVDVNGTIHVASAASLDYEQKSAYSLQAIAHNANGSSDLVSVNIALNNVEDEAPTLLSLTKSIEENATVNTVVGTLRLASNGEGNITDYTLTGTGSENFSIDENGTISVSSSLDYETTPSYTLQATVMSDAGESESTSVRIFILNVAEHVPVLKPFTGSIEEDVGIGTVIGTMEEDVGGDSPIISYGLDENSTFAVDDNGALRITKELNWSVANQYSFYVTATNGAGKSEPVKAVIMILRVYYQGGAGSDELIGSERDEYFNSGEGNDHVSASGGNDMITGGSGEDTLYGGDGDDTYYYTLGDGNDTIEDSSGYDKLIFYKVEKQKCRFEVADQDLILMLEDNSTIRIREWANDSKKIEEIAFSSGEVITSSDFDMPIVVPDAGIVDLSKLNNTYAVQVVQGRIVPVGSGYNSVDHWIFHYQGGELIIDTLSELNSNGESYIDIDGDGKQLGVDIYIHLYKKDANGNWNLVSSNDDSSATYSDGSSHRYDSYFNLNLAAGEYLLAVGNYSLSSGAALEGSNNSGRYPNGGAYQITFNEELDFIQIPGNANGDLYGTDHYNFYTLRNDIDPYNADGLEVLNPIIVNTNGIESIDMGRVESHGYYISYYPEDVFVDLNATQEINIVYDVLNQNGVSCKSLLTLQVIPSLYTHVNPQINNILWENIRGFNCINELNITKATVEENL